MAIAPDITIIIFHRTLSLVIMTVLYCHPRHIALITVMHHDNVIAVLALNVLGPGKIIIVLIAPSQRSSKQHCFWLTILPYAGQLPCPDYLNHYFDNIHDPSLGNREITLYSCRIDNNFNINLILTLMLY
jgi:hypothetical protein